MPNFSATVAAPAPRAASRLGGYCLFLDVDGTLVDFASTPGDVHVDPPLAALIAKGSLALGGALALVSGRTIADLDRLFSPQRWAAPRRRCTGGHSSRPPAQCSMRSRASTRVC